MKKINFFVFLVLGVIVFSSCGSAKRGVQFYSGDKNNEVIAKNLETSSSKRQDLQRQLFRLEQDRNVVLTKIKREESHDIKGLEMEIRRIEYEIQRLNSQRHTVDILAIEAETEKLAVKRLELESLKNSSNSYQKEVSPMDAKIAEMEGLLLTLEMAETQALANNLASTGLDYFEGNLKSGTEAANAYSLMSWSQQNNAGEASFVGIIVNNRPHQVIMTLIHSNGWKMVYDIAPNTSIEIEVPFPGEYKAYSRYEGTVKSGLVSVKKTKKVFHQGKTYFFRILQT
jgi:TolA-binding protein